MLNNEYLGEASVGTVTFRGPWVALRPRAVEGVYKPVSVQTLPVP